MKLSRITVGTKYCDGIREESCITYNGFYYIGMKTDDPLRSKKEKILLDATHFIMYWGKKCAFPEKQGKFIGIYKNKGFFKINNSKELKLLTNNNNMKNYKYKDTVFADYLVCIDKKEENPIGVYLEQLTNIELKMPNNVAVRGDFGNIVNLENINYIKRKLEDIEDIDL